MAPPEEKIEDEIGSLVPPTLIPAMSRP